MIRKVAEILRAAESEIAELVTNAVRDRAYAEVERLIAVARQLAIAAARFEQTDSSALTDITEATAAVDSPANSTLGDESDDDAPIFERDGDDLIKTGKAKEGKVYEHKTPRKTVDILLRTIADKSTKRGEFRTSRVFPLLDGEGRKLPAYQGYLCLRWLRQIGLVQRIARQRYQMVEGVDPSESVEVAWKSLNQRGA